MMLFMLVKAALGAFSLQVAPSLLCLFAVFAMAIAFPVQPFLGPADTFSAIVRSH
jgi:hypothetical protein